MIDKKQLPFWLITFAIMIGLPLSTLIQDGMFMDAVLYTCVARNQAHNFGTFWFPHASKIDLAIPGVYGFHEQPPLAFGIESLFFRVLGDSMYVERFYVFVTMCLTAWLIVLLWKEIFREDNAARQSGWLPVLLWIIIPTVFWGCSNNVNENTMGIFTLSSVLISFKILNRSSRNMLLWILSGVCIFLATLTKGFPGFFPVGVPFLYFLVTRKINFKQGIGYSALLLLVPLFIYGVLFLLPESRESLSVYLFKRAFQRIANAPTTSNRFHTLIDLSMDLIAPVALTLIILLVARLKKVNPGHGKNRLALFFLTIGISATAPLMFTMVQKGFYLIPGFPFFAAGLGILIVPRLAALTSGIKVASAGFRIFQAAGILLLSGAIIFVALQKGKTSRDQATLHDVYIIGKKVPPFSSIQINKLAFFNDSEVQCYLIRYFDIYTDFNPAATHTYLILEKNQPSDVDLSHYKKMDLGLQKYDLYILKP